MSNNKYILREIEPKDNAEIAVVIRKIFIELGIPKIGTAYEDIALDQMFETYDIPNAAYFVIELNGIILGGAGIMQLQNATEGICELQKMYFSQEIRQKGFGAKMINTCLNKAKEFGYKKCYLETIPFMESARKLYTKVGFESLTAPMGDTGHYSCSMWMIKTL